MADAAAPVAVPAKTASPAQPVSAQPVVPQERKISEPPVAGPLPVRPASIPPDDEGRGDDAHSSRTPRSLGVYPIRIIGTPHLRLGSSSRSGFAPTLLPLQCKLAIGSVSDPLEVEADSLADRVMNSSLRRSAVDGPVAVRPQTTASVPSVEAPPVVHQTLRSPGQPLDRQTRAFMESRFGYDFSRVRVHTDTVSAESARAVGAHAYAVGQHIAFAAGAFNPHSASGRSLLAHELAHTLQQGPAAGAHNAVVRRRRIPGSSDVNNLIGPGKTDRAAHVAGLLRLIRNAWTELDPARKAAAMKQAALALINKVEISLQSHPGFLQGSDDWNIQSVSVKLLNAGASKGEIVTASGSPFVRLTKKVPAITLNVTAPAGVTGPFDQIQFSILTGSDDLRGNSTAVATLFTSTGFTLARLALKQPADPEWKENSTHTPTFNLSVMAFPGDTDLLAALEAGTPQQMEEFAREIQVAFPKDVLGDPALIDTGPRPATADAVNINTLVSKADDIFKAVASGSRNADLRDVFGPTHVAQAKAKFAKARTAMHHLHGLNKIVTDRSGYDAEVSLGGLTSPSQIALDPDTIDNPTLSGSIATTVHESMHAGNTDVTDLGYIGSASFTEMTAADKLNNAADYEVIANRILTPADASAFPGKKFVPAGTTVGGITAPALTQKQSAMREASETYRRAWTTALNLHTLFVRVFKRPTEYDTLDLQPDFGVAAGTHFSDSFPYWSKVENMTIHKRPGIASAAGVPASSPVTLIDVAQSESVTRKLAAGMDATDSSKFSEADATTLEGKANAAQTADIAKGAIDEARVLVSLIRSEKIGEITGPVPRDERAIARLNDADKAAAFFDDVLSPKLPASFPD